jgi:hypothetical protein
MEHRYSARAQTDTKLLIYRHALPVAIGRATDVSAHGIFVESDYRQISVNQPLEIEFLRRGASPNGFLRYKAYVVHKTCEGFGLAISDEYAASYRALLSAHDLLTAAPRAAAMRVG